MAQTRSNQTSQITKYLDRLRKTKSQMDEQLEFRKLFAKNFKDLKKRQHYDNRTFELKRSRKSLVNTIEILEMCYVKG